MFELLVKQYIGVWEILKRYWSIYGGISALILSPYFHFSILLSVVMNHFWLCCPWWDIALSSLPTVLGFTLAGFTIWLGFGDEKFRILISTQKNNDKPSAYMGVSSGFIHFIIVQVIAYLTALWAKAAYFRLPEDHWLAYHINWLAPLGSFIGFLIFIYAIMTALAASFAVFRAASWYDRHRRFQSQQHHDTSEDKS
jgi:hypothetical protein